jgi:ankyrin repeat protein
MKKFMHPLFLSLTLCSGVVVSINSLSAMSLDDGTHQDKRRRITDNHNEALDKKLRLYAAIENVDKVKELLKAHANPNVPDEYGRTALMDAAAEGYAEIVELLIAAKANLDIQDNRGDTALICAASKSDGSSVQQRAIIQMLVAHGADVDLRNRDNLTACTKILCYHVTGSISENDANALWTILHPHGLTCPICREENSDTFLIPCSHWFHHGCIDTWRKIKNTCPYCRESIISRSPTANLPHQAAKDEDEQKRTK